MARTVLTAESRPARYFWQLRRYPMLEPQEEYTLAQSWCEYGDRNAAHRLVTSHLRLVIKIALSRLWPADLGRNLRRQRRADACARALRAGERL